MKTANPTLIRGNDIILPAADQEPKKFHPRIAPGNLRLCRHRRARRETRPQRAPAFPRVRPLSTDQEIKRHREKAEPDRGNLGHIQRPRARRLGRIIRVIAEEVVVFQEHPQPEPGPADEEEREGNLNEDDHGKLPASWRRGGA